MFRVFHYLQGKENFLPYSSPHLTEQATVKGIVFHNPTLWIPAVKTIKPQLLKERITLSSGLVFIQRIKCNSWSTFDPLDSDSDSTGSESYPLFESVFFFYGGSWTDYPARFLY